jgi:hypothetical protein
MRRDEGHAALPQNRVDDAAMEPIRLAIGWERMQDSDEIEPNFRGRAALEHARWERARH